VNDSNWQISVAILVLFGVSYMVYAPWALYKELRLKMRCVSSGGRLRENWL
jgi:hypothetical protein